MPEPTLDYDRLAAALAERMAAMPAFKNAGFNVPTGQPAGEITALGEAEAFKAWTHGVKGAARFLRHPSHFDRVLPAGLSAELKAALNEGTAGEGGTVVPAALRQELVKPLANLSYLRQAGARIIPVSGVKTYTVPTLTHSAAATLVSEAGARSTGSEPTTGSVAATPYLYYKLSKASQEVEADAAFDIWNDILLPDWTQAFAEAENAAFTTGNGTSAPQGITVGGTTGVTCASATAITADELIDLYHALDFKYRANAVWMMNDATVKLIRKLQDDNGDYLWQAGLMYGQPDLLLGKRVVVNNSMATVATGAKVIAFGDFSYYWIFDWQEMVTQRLVELYAESGQVGYIGWKRFDGNVMLAAAIQLMAMA